MEYKQLLSVHKGEMVVETPSLAQYVVPFSQ